MTEFGFTILGGPHSGKNENPTCYARTTQRGKYVRYTKARLGKTGKLLAPRLTHWARHQDYIDHVRAAATRASVRPKLMDEIWPMLRAGDAKVIVDVIVQFRGKRHADADHVASTIADALFPAPPRKQPNPSTRRRSYQPVWGFDLLKHAPGDGLVLARVLDFRDEADYAFVAVNVHGPYPRDVWLEGNPVKRFPAVIFKTVERLDDTSRLIDGGS